MAVQQEKSASWLFLLCTPATFRQALLLARVCVCVRCNLYLTRVTHLGVCNAMRQQHAVRLSLLVKEPGGEGDAVSQASPLVLNNKLSRSRSGRLFFSGFSFVQYLKLRLRDQWHPSSVLSHQRRCGALRQES